MTEPAIREALEALAAEALKRDKPLAEGALDVQLDSVQRLTLVVAVEDHFAICFEPEDDEQATTVDDVVRIIARHLEAKHG